MKRVGLVCALAVALVACDSATGPDGPAGVEIRFRTVAPGLSSFTPAWAAAAPDLEGVSAEGSNGTLEVEGVWLVVAEFELEGDDDVCPGIDGDDCHEFEAPPFFLELPLEEGAVTVATGEVPPGVYDEFEFEVEDLDDEDEDDGHGASELMAQIRQQFPDWPAEASALVIGRFTPTDGDPRAFRVYLDAEIEVERELDPPLIVADDVAEPADAVVVEVDPAEWFLLSDGSVLDLSQFDFDQTGQLLEFEAEFEDGFGEIEIEGD